MTEQVKSALAAILQSTEQVQATLGAYVQTTGVESDIPPWVSRHDHVQTQNKRFVAVVTHRDEMHGCEEGSVFVLRHRSDGAQGALDIDRVFPIVGEFSINVAQTRQGSFDPRPSSLPSPTLEPTSTELSLTIVPGQSQPSEPLTLLTSDVRHLTLFLDHCKRLRESINARKDSDTKTHLWLNEYSRKSIPIALLSLVPQDLRIANQPLHTRLSRASVDYPGDDYADIAIIRDYWVRREALQAATDPNNESAIRVRLGTFNVNGRLPSQDVSSWVRGRGLALGARVTAAHAKDEAAGHEDEEALPPSHPKHPASVADTTSVAARVTPSPTEPPKNLLHSPVQSRYSAGENDPDLIVLGFQELDLSAEALIYSTSTEREDAWCMAVFAGLGEKAVFYEKLASRQLVGILIVAIVKKSMRKYFHDVQTSSAGVGIMGTLGNKGATAIRVAFTPPPSKTVPTPAATTLTFVNSHLAAFDDMMEKRNSDFHEISKRMSFFADPVQPAPAVSSLPLSLYESDVLFWLGDLNYRIDLLDAEIRYILGSEHWDGKFEALLEHDQLKHVMQSKSAFVGFEEHPITHPPTYRFDTNSVRDALGYDMKRKPAWTDRILKYPTQRADIEMLSYTNHPEIDMSDHRPASADAIIRIHAHDEAAYASSVRRLCHQVAELGSAGDQDIELSKSHVDLGKIPYKRPTTHTLTIKNVGKKPCAYRFIAAEIGEPIHPEWLRVSPLADVLRPGQTAELTFTVIVDNASATKLNAGPRNIDVVVVLHAVQGKRHFISLAGEYERTCFANPLSYLTRLSGPIRNSLELLPENHAVNAPREIIKLIDWLMTNAGDVDDLFMSPAEAELVDTIRECLDTGDEFPFPSTSIDRKVALAFGETLLQLLSSLPESVIPPALQPKCTQMTNRDEAMELLDELPHVSINVWLSLTAFLHFISHRRGDKTDLNTSPDARPLRLASVFAPILLRGKPRYSRPLITPLAKRNFVMYFLE